MFKSKSHLFEKHKKEVDLFLHIIMNEIGRFYILLEKVL